VGHRRSDNTKVEHTRSRMTGISSYAQFYFYKEIREAVEAHNSFQPGMYL
jgi:hypothetical protein